MKKVFVIAPILLAICFFTVTSFRQVHKYTPLMAAKNKIARKYIMELASLDSFLAVYPAYFPDSSYSIREKKYQELAYRIKEASSFLLYLHPATYYNNIAGPFHFTSANTSQSGVFKAAPDNFVLTGPLGNEPAEQLKEANREQLQAEHQFIQIAITHYRTVYRSFAESGDINKLDVVRLMDALHLEISRIAVIDVANADFIIDSASLPALNGAVNGWLNHVQPFVNVLPASLRALQIRWNGLKLGCLSYLAQHRQYDDFNRMVFTKTYLIPLSAFFHDLQSALHVAYVTELRAIRPEAASVYAKNAIVPDFFADSPDGFYTAKRARLGELLFFDPLLSGNNQRACASCHKPEKAFTDGLTKGLSFDKGMLPRNTSTIIASGFQQQQFWDSRANLLEHQMDTVLNSTSEMHSNFGNAISKLSHSPEYRQLFVQAFPDSRNSGITKADIEHALGVYQRSLTGLNSRFDQYMQGDSSALSTREVDGFNLFMGKAKCGVCHMAPIFNGCVPPFYKISDHHSDGVPQRDSMLNYQLDEDRGIAVFTHNQLDGFSFKTPTVRNSALTAPYMHNGAFKTLERVLDFYNQGGGSKFKRAMRQQLNKAGLPPIGFTLLPVPLGLNDDEKSNIIAFLKCLTDRKTGVHAVKHLPAMDSSDAALNLRKPGGVY